MLPGLGNLANFGFALLDVFLFLHKTLAIIASFN
jgi:hypothetical protein